ncbi:MAG: hypothetical protein AAF270_04845 [Pseudomonadota bacterium]
MTVKTQARWVALVIGIVIVAADIGIATMLKRSAQTETAVADRVAMADGTVVAAPCKLNRVLISAIQR